MTSNARPGTRILGSLRSADGAGVVRIEDRYDTDIDDLWSALTDPGRLGPLVRPGRGRPRPRRRVPRVHRSRRHREAPGAWKRASRRGGCW